MKNNAPNNFLIKGKLLLFLLLITSAIYAQQNRSYVEISSGENQFTLSEDGKSTSLLISAEEFSGVNMALSNLKKDIGMVTDTEPEIITTKPTGLKELVIVGTVGKSPLIAELIQANKIDVSEIEGKWETTLIQTVENPFPGVEEALVIIGSDKRGTIYGIYEISKQIGVSPWYYWADVPVKKQEALYIKNGRYLSQEPKVKYRGIFLNDEEPALGGWARENFDGLNHKFYTHVFELILRMKGNFLWPAMWGKSIFDDDPKSASLANEMGIVLSTSHHEPMSRAQVEWQRYGSGPWDYSKNANVLQEFWTEGFKKNKDYEQIITIAMRGDGDEPMSEESNVKLLEKIVKDQRKIISKVTGKKAEETPQVWALYKEVQEYYDKGMRVPDDVTLLLCDDNWGNIRKLPDVNAPSRKGGYGIYYHVDYVGGPRSYRWINVSQISRIWEQMNLAYSHNVDRIWILNVGDLKPMEFPISFFLDMAWDPTQFNAQNIYQYTQDWCAQQFGEEHAKEAARLLNLYTKYNHRVTPELLDWKTYSLDNYNEFERVRNEYRDLTLDALRLYNFMKPELRDTFDELVLFPANATSNLYDMYFAIAMNKKLAEEKNPKANYWADEVEKCFNRDAQFTKHYNENIANGKWSHMMDQIRIGYNSWAEPKKLVMPETLRVKVPETPNSALAFQEANGYISIEAENYQKAKGSDKVHWEVIPDLSKTVSAITTLPASEYPTDADLVYLEYVVNFESTGEFEVNILLSPTLNFNANKGLRYAISFDGGEEQIVNFNGHYAGELYHWQAERIIKSKTIHKIEAKGNHTLRLRVLEPSILLQKIVIDTGGLKPSYLGPPQSEMIKKRY